MTRTACVLAALAMVWLGFVASAQPANAGINSWTERRNGCSLTCHWALVSGTCRTAFGIKVPCPLRQKRCEKDYCTQTFY